MPIILDGTFNLTTELVGDAELSNNFEGELGTFIKVYIGNYDFYSGTYLVVPKTVVQTLETQDKILLQDVTVKEVPYFETSNDSGGNTVYIASSIGG